MKRNKISLDEKECLICNERKVGILCEFCNICQNCFTEYIKTNFQSNFTISNIKCPNHRCNKIFNIFSVYCLLDRENVEIIEAVLFKKYLNNCEENIVKCPRSGCDFAAFLKNEDIYCHSFTCEICQEKWKNSLIIDKYSKANLKNEISEILINLTCVPCPFCFIKIYKTEGCNHMKCARCQTEFCYLCLKVLKDHERDYVDCMNKEIVKGFFFFILFFLSFLKLSLAFSYSRFILYLIFYSILINFILLNFVSTAYTSALVILVLMLINPYYSAFGFPVTRPMRFISFGLLMTFTSTHYYLYFNTDFFYSCTNFVLKEVAVLILLGLVGALFYLMCLILISVYRRTYKY